MLVAVVLEGAMQEETKRKLRDLKAVQREMEDALKPPASKKEAWAVLQKAEREFTEAVNMLALEVKAGDLEAREHLLGAHGALERIRRARDNTARAGWKITNIN